jgi:hypothetical protein
MQPGGKRAARSQIEFSDRLLAQKGAEALIIKVIEEIGCAQKGLQHQYWR